MIQDNDEGGRGSGCFVVVIGVLGLLATIGAVATIVSVTALLHAMLGGGT